MRRFHGRRPADIFAIIETAAGTKLPADFAATVAAATLRRLRVELRAIAHAAHALTWIRGPKAVASSSPPERIRLSLDVTGLMRFFEPRLFSASHVRHGKPAPDLFLLAATCSQVDPANCIVVEDSAPGIRAAAAGMTPIGFVGRQPHTRQACHRPCRGRRSHRRRGPAQPEERHYRFAGMVAGRFFVTRWARTDWASPSVSA